MVSRMGDTTISEAGSFTPPIPGDRTCGGTRGEQARHLAGRNPSRRSFSGHLRLRSWECTQPEGGGSKDVRNAKMQNCKKNVLLVFKLNLNENAERHWRINVFAKLQTIVMV